MFTSIVYRPSTPIYELLEHKYQDRWIADRSAQLERGRKKQYQTNAEFKNGNFAVNRTMVLRMHQDPVEAQPLWTMPKFSKNVSVYVIMISGCVYDFMMNYDYVVSRCGSY